MTYKEVRRPLLSAKAVRKTKATVAKVLMFSFAFNVVLFTFYEPQVSEPPARLPEAGERTVVTQVEPSLPPDPCAPEYVTCNHEMTPAFIREAITAYATAYEVDVATAIRIATCESSLNPDAVNASSGAMGLYQFLPSTWAWIGGRNAFDINDNITEFMTWYPKHPDWWVCK